MFAEHYSGYERLEFSNRGWVKIDRFSKQKAKLGFDGVFCPEKLPDTGLYTSCKKSILQLICIKLIRDKKLKIILLDPTRLTF